MLAVAAKLDFLRRFLGTTFGFVIFGVVGVVSKIVLYKYAKNYPNHTFEEQQKARLIVNKCWRFFVKYLTVAGVLEVEYVGFDKLGRPGQLVIANHPSLLDVVLIFSQNAKFNVVVKQDLLNNPSMRTQILSCGFLPNTQSEELLHECDDVLKTQPLLLFAEGTRTGWDGIVKLNRGAVSIGLRSAKVITPIKIEMSPLNFKKNQPWYKMPAKRIKYKLTVGEDIDPQTWLAEKPLPIASRRLTAFLEQYFNS